MLRRGKNNRGEWTSFIAAWLVVFAVTGGIAAVEAVRIADAHATVADGWATGVAAGSGVDIALAASLAATVLARRQRPWSLGRPQVILILTSAVLLAVAFVPSTPRPQSGPHQVHHVITSGIEVAEITYIATFFAALAMVAVAWLVARVRHGHPS